MLHKYNAPQVYNALQVYNAPLVEEFALTLTLILTLTLPKEPLLWNNDVDVNGSIINRIKCNVLLEYNSNNKG